MSRIIKQVQVNHAPVLINSLRLAAGLEDSAITNSSNDNVREAARQIIVQAEQAAAAYIEQAKSEMARQSAALYQESKEQGFAAGFAQGMEQGKEQGHKQGYADGFAAGEQAAHAKMAAAINDAIAEASKIMTAADQQVKQTILSAEPQIIEIALAIAAKILAREIDSNDQAVLSVVKAALEKVRGQEQITIRVNPKDFACVIAAKSEFEAILQREQSVDFTADQTVGRGGCVIDTAFGTADARIETQLQAIEATIRSMLA